MNEYSKFTSFMVWTLIVILVIGISYVSSAKADLQEAKDVSAKLMSLVVNKPVRTIENGTITYSLNDQIHEPPVYGSMIEELLNNKQTPITINVVFNHGGYFDTLKKLVYTINMSNVKVVTIGYGNSAGAMLSCSDAKIFIYPGGKLNFHWIRIDPGDGTLTNEYVINKYNEFERFLYSTCVKNNVLTIDEVKNMRAMAERYSPNDIKPFFTLTAEQIKQRVGDKWEEIK